MGNRIYHIGALILILLQWSCTKVKEDCTQKGEFTSINREVEPFTNVQVGDRIDVILRYDPNKVGQIVLSGPGNLFSGIHTDVQNGKLEISDKNRCKWLRSLKDRVQCEVFVDFSLKYLYSKDDGAFHCADTLKSDHIIFIHESTHDQEMLVQARAFWIQHKDAGQVNMQGSCDVLEVINYETGIYSGRNFESNYAFIYQYGLNEVHVKSDKTLHCKVENTGNIYYHIKPVDTLTVSGKGLGQVLFVK